MTKIQIELPDATAKAAGLLTPKALDRLVTGTIRPGQARPRHIVLISKGFSRRVSG